MPFHAFADNGVPAGNSTGDASRELAQVIFPTIRPPIIVIPTQPPIVFPTLVNPTFIIPLPSSTPTPTPSPTPSPTPIPVLDIGFHFASLDTDKIVHSIAGLDAIRGMYEIFVLTSPPSSLPITTTFELVNSANAVIKTWTRDEVLSQEGNPATYTKSFQYEFPIALEDKLPLDTYRMRISVVLHKDQIDPPAPEGYLLDPNETNNTAETNMRNILHLSGRMTFDDIETTLSQVSTFDLAPLKLSGQTEWDAGTPTISVPFADLFCDRDPGTLDLTVTNGSAPFTPPADPYQPDGSSWAYRYFNGALNQDGAFAFIATVMPSGLGFRVTASQGFVYVDKLFPLGNLKLKQDLQLASTAVDSPLTITWSYESLGFVIQSDSQVFDYTRGYILNNPKPVYRFTPHFTAGFGPGVRGSNCGYLQGNISFNGEVLIEPSGIKANLVSDPVTYNSAFPYKAQTTLTANSLSIQSGRIQTGLSQAQSLKILMAVNRSDCASSIVNVNAIFSGQASFAGDGSFAADSALTTAVDPDFNTYNFQPASQAAWYQPGIVLPANGMKNGTDVAEYLQAMRERGSPTLRSYGAAAFTNGTGLFAGLNLMPEAFQGQPFTAQIDVNTLDFISTEWTKLYVRPGGYSGVVDAQSAGQAFQIYADPECGGDGYDIKLTSFGQAYLDNDSGGLSSTIDGQIDIPWPSGITVPFEDMTLNGCGNFTGGQVPADAQKETRTLAYWQADLRVLTFAFNLRPGAVNDNERTLWISSKNTIAGLDDKPLMQTNIRPCGTIRDSKIENTLLTRYDGYKTTIQKIYLSTYDGTNSPNGFYNLIGDLVVSFFNPPKIHVLVRGLVGEIVDGDPWFTMPDPDADKNGFPSTVNISSTQIEAKFAEYVKEAPVNVRTQFANIIDLKYEIEYNKSKKEFASTAPLQHNLIVVDIKSAVEYLNASKTEISFGVEIGSLPELNLSSAASQFTGTIQNTFLGPVRDQLEEVSGKLTGDLTTFIRPPLKGLIKPPVQAMLNAMKNQLNTLDPSQYATYINSVDFQNQLNNLFVAINFNNVLRNPNVMPAVNLIQDVIQKIHAVSDILHYNPANLTSQLGPLVQTLMDMALNLLQAQTGYNLNQVLQPVQQVVNQINHILDTEILPLLDSAEAFFANPTIYLDQFFKPADISAYVTNIQNALKSNLLSVAGSTPAQLKYVSADQVTDAILNALFNTQMFQQLNNTLVTQLFPIKDALLDQAQEILDSVNDAVSSFIKTNLGDFIDGVTADIKDTIGFKGASMKGYAIISGNIMEKLHIDADFSMSTPEFTFAAYLDMTRYQVSNSGKNCFANLSGEDVIDCRIGTKNVDLGFTGASLTAEIIEVKLMISAGKLVNVGGTIQTKGSLGFESFQIVNPSFGVAAGKVENYFWASTAVKFEGYTLKGGIFLGISCDLEPLKIIDPKVASLLTITEMRGIFLSVGGSFPILNFGCMLRVGVSAEVAFWYFVDGPTYGGKLVAGAYGRAGCVVSVKGQLTLIGGRDSSGMIFNGNAWVGGGIGFCDPEDWHSPADVLDDDWCASCVAVIDLIYKNKRWDADYDVDCSL